MRPAAWRRWTVLVALAGVAACGVIPGGTLAQRDREPGPATPAGGPVVVPPDPALLTRPIEDAVALLSDPATAEDGAWVLLAGLGLGVYSGAGEQLLAGSESGPDDLWLLDGAVPGLARLAHGEPLGFDRFHAALAADGLELTEDELRAIYHAAVRLEPQRPLARVLTAWPVDLTDPELELTPLQAWLLLLGLLPANPEPGGAEPLAAPRSGMAAVADLSRAAARGLVRAADDCELISGSGATSGWDLMQGLADRAESSARGEALDELESQLGGRTGPAMSALDGWSSRLAKALEAVTVLLALDSISTELTVDQASVRRLQDREPDGSQAVVLTAAASSEHVPPVRCGELTGVELPGGPLEGARVHYELDGDLAQHGHLRPPGGDAWQQLDVSGRSEVRYETIRDDPPDAHRHAPAQHRSGTVTARFDSLLHAMGEPLDLFANVELVAGIAGMFDRTTTIEVRWHEIEGHGSEQGPVQAFDTVTTALGDVVQVDLVSCDGGRGSWHGTVHHVDFFDIPWTAEISFAFPEGQVEDASVTWGPGQAPALLDDDEPLYDVEFAFRWEYRVAYVDTTDPPVLRFDGAITGEFVGLSEYVQDASFEVPVHPTDDERCGG